MNVLIAGCGFTGHRVALRFLARGAGVIATTRQPEKLQSLAAQGVKVIPYSAGSDEPLRIPAGTLVLHSLPTIEASDPTPALLRSLGNAPARIVYLSTTGVYGDAKVVDEFTPVNPRNAREQARLDAEQAVRNGPWSSMVLRPAAIYGPGRGIHVSMTRGDFLLVGDGSNFVSRIHVDDLAAHAEAALLSDIDGAWPVADEEPCQSREIADFCSRLLNVPMPASVAPDAVHHTRRADRRVDGSGIRRRLGISLQYPSFRTGIPASL